MWKWVREHVDASDVCLVGGCGCVVWGAAQVSLAAAWMIGGCILVGFAVIITVAKVGAKRR